MRILILSFYFPPDLSAGSFRAKALVDALRRARPDIEIDIITTTPNRYRSHAQSAIEFEAIPGVEITRIPLSEHRSGMRDQARAFVGFAGKVLARTRGRRWSLVYATSSRLMTAVLGAVVSRRSGAPLYLDMRDLFTDTMRDVMAHSPALHLLWFFDIAERWTFRSAARINLVSQGFIGHAMRVAPNQHFRVFTNGIDPEFLTTDFCKPARESADPLHILYAGNIGEGQGLHTILPSVAKSLEGRARFTVIGDGGRRQALAEGLRAARTTNVDIIDPVPRAQLFNRYAAADILFLHLNDHAAFLKVLPSKIFEYAATGKPVLAGVAGYAADFLERNVPGSAVFMPCDAQGMIAAIDTLTSGPDHVDRERFRHDFARETIMDQLAGDILAIAEPDGSKP